MSVTADKKFILCKNYKVLLVKYIVIKVLLATDAGSA